jgi:predicted nucleic acid-binding protein
MRISQRYPEVLVDTNMLVYLASGQGPFYLSAQSAIKVFADAGTRLSVSRQNLVEFWAVCTKPTDVGGLGLAPDAAAARLEDVEGAFHVLTENDDIYLRWREIVSDYGVVGRQVHDARLVAAMTVHGVQTILTKNARDFKRYNSIQALQPEDVEAAVK